MAKQYEKSLEELGKHFDIPLTLRAISSYNEDLTAKEAIYNIYGAKLLKKAYVDNITKGHIDRQHWYPRFLIKYFRETQINSQLNKGDFLTRIPLKAGVRPFNLLYSEMGIWSQEVEGAFNGVENLLAGMLDTSNINGSSQFFDFIDNNELAKILFGLLSIVNLHRAPSVMRYTYNIDNDETPNHENMFLGEESIEYLINSAIMYSIGTWELHETPNMEILFTEEPVKLIPKNITHKESYLRRDLSNSCLFIPISHNKIITVVPCRPSGEKWNSVFNYLNLASTEANDIFNVYNSISMLLNNIFLTNNKALLYS